VIRGTNIELCFVSGIHQVIFPFDDPRTANDALKDARWSHTAALMGLGKAQRQCRSTLNPSTAVCKVWQYAPVVLSPRN